MIPAFLFFPPEINSALMFGGAGSGSLFTAASAWDGLAADLAGAAASFDSVISDVTGAAWRGPASASMTAAATPYVQWLNAAAGQAEAAAAQARAAATAFETARATTVPTPAVVANRTRLLALIATNFLGQNTPAIAMTEAEYVEMWLQDVAAMLGYHSQAVSVASTLPSFSAPPGSLAGLANLVTTPLTDLVPQVAGAVSTAGTTFASQVQSAVAAISPALSPVSSLVSSAPVSTLSSAAQVGMYPASALMSPMMMLTQSAGQEAPALAGATNLASEAPNVAGASVPGWQPVTALGVLGVSAALGNAHLVGAISVPSTWQGSMPAQMTSPAMSGPASELPAAAATADAAGNTGGMPMPMAKDGSGGRDRVSNPHVVQSRPRVVPRTVVG